MVKIIKKKIASKTSENDEIEYQEDLLIRQENNWKTYSTVYDEIREDCRQDCSLRFRQCSFSAPRRRLSL